MSLKFKQFFLGNRFGDFALSARERIRLVRAALREPETVGTVANDFLAGKLLSSICKRTSTFLDVGAHIGSVIANVRKHAPSVNIIAVEAVPDKAKALMRKFPNIVIHSCAVSADEGEATFFVDTQRSGYSSLISPGRNAHVEPIKVSVRKLDNIIPSSEDVDVVKLDVEGAELEALRGAIELLSNQQPLVMFESGAVSDSDCKKRELFDFFQKRDYAIVAPGRLAHNDDGLTRDGFLECHLYPRITTNYFAVPRHRRTEFRDRARDILNIRVDSS